MVYNLEGSIFKWANEGKDLEDNKGLKTVVVHPYNVVWGKLLNAELRCSEPRESSEKSERLPKLWPQIHVNSSHSPVTTSTNHINDQSMNHITTTVNHPTHIRNQTVRDQPVINAPDHSTPIHNRIRRRKRKTETNRYWRRDNRNIQLDTNAVINCLLGAFPFVLLLVTSTGLRLELISMNSVDGCVMTIAPPSKLTITNFVPKAIGPLPYTGTLHLTLKPAPVRNNLTTRERQACKMLSRQSECSFFGKPKFRTCSLGVAGLSIKLAKEI